MRDPDPAWRACQPVGGKSTWVNHLGGRSRITVRDCELRLLQSRSVIHDKLHGNHSKIPLPDTALPPSPTWLTPCTCSRYIRGGSSCLRLRQPHAIRITSLASSSEGQRGSPCSSCDTCQGGAAGAAATPAASPKLSQYEERVYQLPQLPQLLGPRDPQYSARESCYGILCSKQSHPPATHLVPHFSFKESPAIRHPVTGWHPPHPTPPTCTLPQSSHPRHSPPPTAFCRTASALRMKT